MIFIMMVLLIGCRKEEVIDNNKKPNTDFEKEIEEIIDEEDRDGSYNEDTSINIYLNETSITCNSDKVIINEKNISIIDGGTFIIQGKLNDGSIIINAQNSDEVHLVLNNVEIKSSSFAPIYIMEADKTIITNNKESINTLSTTGEYIQIDNNNVDGTLFSKQDISINGSGILNILSNHGKGIVCKDSLVIADTNINVYSKDHGINTNDSIGIINSNLTIESRNDGIHCENSEDDSLGSIIISGGIININSEDDGISSSSTIQIDLGEFNIYTSNSYTDENTSVKGIKAKSSILINDGKFIIHSYDDSIHSNGSIVIHSGVFEIKTNDDGIHADETLLITNGTINIINSYEGLEALTINISGGNINIIAKDDGINAAGGNDSSGVSNPGMPSRPGGRPSDHFGGNMSSSSNGNIEISGGYLYIQASRDGIDSNGNLLISGGIIYVCGPTSGDTSVLDFNGSGKITGGEFYGSGAYMMAQTLTSDTQGVLAVRVGNASANTEVIITNSSNEIVAKYIPKLSYQIIIVSNSKIVKKDTYTITIGETSGEIQAQ